MAAAKRTKVLFADDTALFNADADGRVEVVTLAHHEHILDAKIERIRELEAIQRGLGRILEARGEDPLAAAVRLVEEVEHYRDRRHAEPLVAEEEVTVILRQVPRLEPMTRWSLVGWAPNRVAVLAHPGMEGVVLVSAEAWEFHRCLCDMGST